MINIPNAVKTEYKDYEREIEVYGNLYLASYRPSSNLLDETAYLVADNCTFQDGEFVQTTADTQTRPAVILQAYNNTTFVREINRYTINLGEAFFEFTKTNDFNALRFKVNGSQRDTAVRYDISNLTNGTTYYFGATFTNITQGSITFRDIFINTTQDYYEEYGATTTVYRPAPLTEEYNRKILSFNINEKTDIYYTSLPYNTMTIEVDNEIGFFTVEDEHSILDELTKDSYIDLFMKINNGTAYKIMTMNFVKISYSDYEKAKLEFASCLYRINNNEILFDKYGELETRPSANQWKKYLYNNYKINWNSNHYDYVNNLLAVNTYSRVVRDLKSMLLGSATKPGLHYAETLTINNYNNDLIYKAITDVSNETISKNLQLEKPILKKDNIYKAIKNTRETSYQENTSNYTKTIYHKLRSTKDVIVYRDTDYKLSDITSSDITTTGTPNVELKTIQSQNYNLYFTITGNIGDEVYITIDKSNIIHRSTNGTETYGYTTDYNNEEKILIVNENAPMLSGVYDFLYIKKPILNYVEVQMKGLPYIEIGDTISIELDNATKKIIITEIDMNFDGGLTETIKGYELDWGHQAFYPYDDLNGWGGLYPRDDLYPNNNLYPY